MAPPAGACLRRKRRGKLHIIFARSLIKGEAFRFNPDQGEDSKKKKHRLRSQERGAFLATCVQRTWGTNSGSSIPVAYRDGGRMISIFLTLLHSPFARSISPLVCQTYILPSVLINPKTYTKRKNRHKGGFLLLVHLQGFEPGTH